MHFVTLDLKYIRDNIPINMTNKILGFNGKTFRIHGRANEIFWVYFTKWKKTLSEFFGDLMCEK